MKFNPTVFLVFALIFASTQCANALDLVVIPHRTIADKRTFVRADTDKRYSVWTDDPAKVVKMIEAFAIEVEEKISLGEGEIFAIFLNDQITEDLVQITHNKTANQILADYADSGIRFKLKNPGAGKKYSHLTAIIFKPENPPTHLGIRSRIVSGLSEKQ